MSGVIHHGLRRLYALRDRDGWWRAYRMAPGQCRDWVSALAGLALAEIAVHPAIGRADRARARATAEEMADMLLAATRAAGAWGYNHMCPCDSDTTAAVLRLFHALDRPMPEPALRFLAAHGTPDTGYATYLGDDPEHGWQRPGTEVDCAVATVLFLGGMLGCDDVARMWKRVAASQNDTGAFPAYWYPASGVASFVALEFWALTGRPDPAPRALPPVAACDASHPFDLAHLALAAAAGGQDTRPYMDRLGADQIAPGRWPATARLLAPQGRADPGYSGEASWEGTGVMTTIATLRACLRAGAPAEPKRAMRHPEPALPGRMARLAGDLGLSDSAASAIRAVSDCLHRDLGATPWPNPASSGFAKGYPVEFSAQLAAKPAASFRFAGETGDPGLPAAARARSALARIEEAASALDLDDQMAQIRMALQPVLTAAEEADPGERFFLWAGLELIEKHGGFRAALKVYANLALAGDSMELAAATLRPFSADAARSASAMDAEIGAAGRAQEIGFAAVTGGQPVAKLYWELDGYSAAATRRAMDHVGLGDAETLSPEIPGLVPAGLGAELSSGIAVRIDPASGVLPDLTLATETPLHIRYKATHERDAINAWAESQGWSTAQYWALQKALSATASGQTASAPRSLHTITQKSDTRHASLYVRPETWLTHMHARPDIDRQHLEMEENYG